MTFTPIWMYNNQTTSQSNPSQPTPSSTPPPIQTPPTNQLLQDLTDKIEAISNEVLAISTLYKQNYQNNDIFQKNVSCKVVELESRLNSLTGCVDNNAEAHKCFEKTVNQQFDELENKLKENNKNSETALNYQLDTITTLIDRIEKLEEQKTNLTNQEIDDLKKKVEELEIEKTALEVEKSTLEAEKSAQTSTISDLAKKLQAYHANEVTKEDYTEYNKFWHNFFGLPFEEDKNDESWQKASQSPNLLQKGVNEHIRAMCEKASQKKKANNGIGSENAKILNEDEVKYVFDHFEEKRKQEQVATDKDVIELMHDIASQYPRPVNENDIDEILKWSRNNLEQLRINIDRWFHVDAIQTLLRNFRDDNNIIKNEDDEDRFNKEAKKQINNGKTYKDINDNFLNNYFQINQPNNPTTPEQINSIPMPDLELEQNSNNIAEIISRITNIESSRINTEFINQMKNDFSLDQIPDVISNMIKCRIYDIEKILIEENHTSTDEKIHDCACRIVTGKPNRQLRRIISRDIKENIL